MECLGLAVVIYLRSILFFIFWTFFAWELYQKYVRKESRKKAISELTTVIAVPEAHFTNYGLPIPAELHQSALPFVQMCDLAYPGLGRIARIPFHRGLIEHIQLEGTKAEEQVVKMRLRFTYEIYPESLSAMKQSEEYYQVGARTRLVYGLSYVGLAVFLGWMMTLTHSLFALQPLIG